MKYIDGKSIAERIEKQLKKQIEKLPHTPGLGVILVGYDPASQVYVKRKEEAAKRIGIRVVKYELPTETPEKQVIELVKQFNKDKSINGILVQLPLPPQINTGRVIATISPTKDADGFLPKSKTQSPTHQAILKLMESTHPSPRLRRAGKKKFRNKTYFIFANSAVFKKPLAEILTKKGLKPSGKSADADFVITACGKPEFLKSSKIKKGAMIIDVGTTRINGKLLGDVDQKSVAKKASWLSPVPGGVGPLTVIFLLKNIIKLSKIKK